MVGLASNHNKGLPVLHLNLECLLRLRTDANISNPVVADIARIEAPQISRSEDGIVVDALGAGIDGDALSCTGSVGERVSVVTEWTGITKDRACRGRGTGLRSTAV